MFKNECEGVVDVEIVSVFLLNGVDFDSFVLGFECKFKCKLKLMVEVDLLLIGGVCVMVGDEVFDILVCVCFVLM